MKEEVKEKRRRLKENEVMEKKSMEQRQNKFKLKKKDKVKEEIRQQTECK